MKEEGTKRVQIKTAVFKNGKDWSFCITPVLALKHDIETTYIVLQWLHYAVYCMIRDKEE